jgi:hypothetical protein
MTDRMATAFTLTLDDGQAVRLRSCQASRAVAVALIHREAYLAELDTIARREEAARLALTAYVCELQAAGEAWATMSPASRARLVALHAAMQEAQRELIELWLVFLELESGQSFTSISALAQHLVSRPIESIPALLAQLCSIVNQACEQLKAVITAAGTVQ